ncbi:MAG: GTA-gp10 family protein [Pseudomonadota bacterium]
MNAQRGEVDICIDGEARRLCLTLGALAALEQAFACNSLAALQARLKRLSAGELKQVLEILLAAGGNPCSVETVLPSEAAKAVAEAFHAALG